MKIESQKLINETHKSYREIDISKILRLLIFVCVERERDAKT